MNTKFAHISEFEPVFNEMGIDNISFLLAPFRRYHLIIYRTCGGKLRPTYLYHKGSMLRLFQHLSKEKESSTSQDLFFPAEINESPRYQSFFSPTEIGQMAIAGFFRFERIEIYKGKKKTLICGESYNRGVEFIRGAIGQLNEFRKQNSMIVINQ